MRDRFGLGSCRGFRSRGFSESTMASFRFRVHVQSGACNSTFDKLSVSGRHILVWNHGSHIHSKSQAPSGSRALAIERTELEVRRSILRTPISSTADREDGCVDIKHT